MRVPQFALLFLISIALPCFCAETPEELEAKGAQALKEAQTNPNAIISAVIFYGKAAARYDEAANTAKATEMNSFLYWCKKKMTLPQMDEFLKLHDADSAAVTKRLKELDEAAPVADAQAYLDRAEAYARAHPNEHLLVAIRFFEVADRFKATDIGVAAMDRSLKAMQQAGAAKPEAPAKPVAVPPPAEGSKSAGDKLPIPDNAKLKEAEKQVKDVFKTEYAATTRDDRVALAKKLLQYGADTKDKDAAVKYVQLREARDIAAANGDPELAFNSADAIAEAFVADPLTERITALQKASATSRTREPALALAKLALRAIDDAAALDEHEKIKPLFTLAESAAIPAGDAELVSTIKEKLKWIAEVRRDWPRVQTALEKLKTNPNDPGANLIAGSHRCYLKSDWTRGIPMLARGSDANLKALAEKELEKPSEPEKQAEIGNLWWQLAEKNTTAQKPQMARAKEWYQQAQPRLSGLEKAKVDKRLAALSGMQTTAEGTVNLMRLIDTKKDKVQGEWELKDGELTSSKASPAAIQIPYQPPAEYNFKVSFTKQSGTDSISQYMYKNNKEFSWVMGGGGGSEAGIEKINGKGRNDNPTSAKIHIESNKRYTSVIEVRNTGIKVFLDNKVVAEHKTDYRDISNDFYNKNIKTLGLGTWSSVYTFHSIELIEVTGKGKALRE